MFARHLRYWKRWKLATFRRFCKTPLGYVRQYAPSWELAKNPKNSSNFQRFRVYIFSNSRQFIGKGDPKRYFCTFGEKEQTSKRQTNEWKEFVWSKVRFATRTLGFSEPAEKNTISSNSRRFIGKVFCVILRSLTGTPRDTVYPWGKGINKQKTSIFVFSVKWLVKSAVYDVSPGRVTVL